MKYLLISILFFIVAGAQALSPYSDKFINNYDELSDLYEEGAMQTKTERREFIKSKGIDPDIFNTTFKKYKAILNKIGREGYNKKKKQRDTIKLISIALGIVVFALGIFYIIFIAAKRNGQYTIQENDYVASIRDLFINYFNFKGRTSRVNFWFATFLFIYPIYFFLPVVVAFIPNITIAQLLLTIPYIGLFVPHISIHTRRLHDINKSGWWQLLNYTGIGIIYILYLASKKGDEGDNRFGSNPESQFISATASKPKAKKVKTVKEESKPVVEDKEEEYDDEIQKIEKVEKMYKDKLITEEERQKMRNKILGID